jgi:uncharacterized membrane protein
MTYDLSLFNSTYVSNVGEMAGAVNTASGGIFALLILGTVFIFFLMAFRDNLDYGVNNWIASSFFTTIVGSLMFFMGWIDWSYLAIPIGLLIVSISLYYFQ